jgi:transketolase
MFTVLVSLMSAFWCFEHCWLSALKKDDITQLKEKFGFNPQETFVVPQEVTDLYAKLGEKGAKAEAEWNEMFKKYAEKYPTEASELQRRIDGRLPDGWEKALPTYTTEDAAVGSRKLSETTINKLAEVLPEFIGGSADLTGSNLTRWKGAEDFQHPSTGLGSYKGRYFRFGVREHGMTAIANGLAAYGGIIPFVATFLNFVSYAAGAVRLSALSHFRVLNIGTHDSIGLGEDGPTHQPVETPAWLRATPNLAFWRPADGNETSAAYLVALLSQHTPSVMAFSRQNVSKVESFCDEYLMLMTASPTRWFIHREGHQGWLRCRGGRERRHYHRLYRFRSLTLSRGRRRAQEEGHQGTNGLIPMYRGLCECFSHLFP